MGKTNPLNDLDLEEFVEMQKTFADSTISWSIDVAEINVDTWDLSVKNPHASDEVVHRSPVEVMFEIEKLDAENQDILKRIKEYL
jgi:type I restriction enzyme M protein